MVKKWADEHAPMQGGVGGGLAQGLGLKPDFSQTFQKSIV
jgi:hypothetical protein